MNKFLKGVLRVIKYLLLLPIYCSMPDKYSGIMPDEWMDGKRANDK